MKILPAGVPRGLIAVRHRVAAVCQDAPLLFIGVVVGIAVLFRIGIGALRPASAESEPPASVTRVAGPPGARHEPATTPSVPSEPAAGSSTATASTSMGAGPLPRRGHDGAPSRKKPRTHGRR